MGREWDSDRGGKRQWVDWLASIMREALRVLKPGAHAFVWALPKTAHWTAWALEDAGFEIRDVVVHLFGTGFPKNKALLKPGAEHWVLCRKPLSEPNIVANVDRWGTGLLNIDAGRISLSGENVSKIVTRGINLKCVYALGKDAHQHTKAEYNPAGRWPANVILSPEAAEELDKQSGHLKSGIAIRRNSGGKTFGSEITKPAMPDLGYGDTGGASRFFYIAKPSAKEKHGGCEDGNKHPTVKPLSLMNHLISLVTPPGGTVLDPFLGSGTTGAAAASLGFDFIGIEQDADFLATARERIAHARLPEQRIF